MESPPICGAALILGPAERQAFEPTMHPCLVGAAGPWQRLEGASLLRAPAVKPRD